MQHEAREKVTVLALAGLLAGCQAARPDGGASATSMPAVPASTAHEDRSSAGPTIPIHWASADDCLGQLKLLHAAAVQGRLEAAHAPPFAIVSAPPSTSLEWIRAPTVPLILDLPLSSYEDQGAAAAAAPCLLLVEQPGEVHAAHRVIDFQNVASLYQTGVRSERNPDYDAAQARLREAERESRSGGPDILRVGDPMLDLVGLVVGGVIATFGHVGSGDEVDEALTALKETPRSLDRPVYRAYEFERSTVRAGKEATIPIALRDLRRGQVWRTQLRQREMRQFAVIEGLDARDRDYEQHRAGAFSWEEFDHWQRQPPQLPVSAVVAALVEPEGAGGGPRTNGSELAVDAGSITPPTRSSMAADAMGGEPSSFPLVATTDPGAGPGTGSTRTGAPFRAAPAPQPSLDPAPGRERGADRAATVLAAARDPRMASVVRVETGGRRGGGFYVQPRLVVTTADLVGTDSIIDITTSDGEKALGLVVLTDAARNLAVVHVPRTGPPAPLSDPPPWAGTEAFDVLELLGHDRARVTLATLQPPGPGDGNGNAARFELDLAGVPAAVGAPVFLNQRAVGLVAAQDGPRHHLVPIDGLPALLESGPLAGLR